MSERIQYIKCKKCQNFIHPNSSSCQYCGRKLKNAFPTMTHLYLFSVLTGVAIVAWMFYGPSNPAPTTPYAWPEALSLISADRPNFSALSQAERNELTEGYHTILVRSASKCGTGITETTDLIMAVGDEIEAKKPSVESPRGKALLSITRDMPDGSYCFAWLAEVTILFLDAP